MTIASSNKIALNVFGLGSPLGDDQAGWLVVQQLITLGLTQAMISRNPYELLDQLVECTHAVIVDATLSDAPNNVGHVEHFFWPDPRLRSGTKYSTHGMDLVQILNMAAGLGKLPPKVEIYTVNIAAPNISIDSVKGMVSARVMKGIKDITDRIWSRIH